MADAASAANSAGHKDTLLNCSTCGKQFSRSEHLARHSHIHLQEKSVECGYCGKAFGRKDSAKRHEQLHTREASAEAPKSRAVSLCRTCSTCAKSRIKCLGGTPCNHCAARSLDCVYLPRKRKRTQYKQDQEPSLDDQKSPVNPASDTGQSPVPNDLGGMVTTWASPSNQQDGPSHNLSNAGAFDESGSQMALEPETLQDQTSQNFAGELPVMSPQWLERSMATNWLPFDVSLNGDFILPSPENMLPTYPSEVPRLSGTVLEDPATETLNEPQGSQDGVDFVLQQDCVSALINSMGGSLQGYADGPNSPHPSSTHSSTQQNILYADGAGFRSSQADRCIRERQETYTTPSSSGDHSEGNSWLTVFSNKVHGIEQHPDPQFDIPEDIFQEILSRLRPSSGEQLLSKEFLANEAFLLNKSAFSLFLKLYFNNFHKLYPFVDRSFLCIPIWGWSLTLAVAAIGTRYLGLTKLTSHGEELCAVLHELLLKQLQFGRVQDSLPYIQARMLAAIGLCQSRQPHWLKCGHSAWALVTNSCLQLRLLDEDDRIGAYQEGQSLEQTWIAWRFRETRRRTGLFIWLTDCFLAFATENPPTLPPQRLKLRLPCKEELWEAESAQGWLALTPKENVPDRNSPFYVEESMRELVQDIMQKLWRGLRTPEMTTQFATFIILHMLLRRRWETSHYLTDSISAVESPSSRDSAPPKRRYVGEIPAYIKWRNYTCDCLDLLHWEALSASTKAGGFEGPVFLQLHLARLVILAPVRELLDHVSASIQPGSSQLLPHNLYHFPDPNRKWSRTLFTWAYQDRFKARLAIIHAGAVLWHTRRYSAASFIEPYTIFLATLILWAFGMAPRVVKGHQLKKPGDAPDHLLHDSGDIAVNQLALSNSTSGSETGERLFPSSPFCPRDPSLNGRRMPRLMQLDRPMDDELVQHFIRSGDGMRLYLEGVDDLCSEEGPWQVLQEGVAILQEEPRTWTIAESYASTLAALASAGNS
ncbi:hypothetical protein BKA56DRAFT_675945 [Ilyonectria sp. MPI-CAGE-AT-0026]|nr:hypothetical protein BKA56DRAFT_675945 [Ilyonectria sp. MPI-CAGE-AT-0026]